VGKLKIKLKHVQAAAEPPGDRGSMVVGAIAPLQKQPSAASLQQQPSTVSLQQQPSAVSQGTGMSQGQSNKVPVLKTKTKIKFTMPKGSRPLGGPAAAASGAAAVKSPKGAAAAAGGAAGLLGTIASPRAAAAAGAGGHATQLPNTAGQVSTSHV
jgi:hypothetical protein